MKHVWVKKCVKICVILFKMWKSEFEIACQIGPKWAETVWNCDVSICQTNFALSFVYGENTVFFSVFAYEFYVPVWIEHFSLNPALHFSSFFFFFLLSRVSGRRQNLLFMRQMSLFMHCFDTVHVVFMGPTATLFRKKY